MAFCIPDEGADQLLSVFENDSNFDPSQVWVGLFKGATPSTCPARTAALATDDAQEVAADAVGYARVQVTAWAPESNGTPSGRKTHATVVFPTAGAGGWGTINGFFLTMYPDRGAGVALAYANFDDLTPRTLNDGDTLTHTFVLRVPTTFTG